MFKASNITVAMIASALAFSLPIGAIAHEGVRGPNGGTLVDIEGHHVEFVPSAGDLTFYLTDEQAAPIASAGAKVKAIVQDQGKTAQIDLAVVEPNKLVGKLAAPLSQDAKVVFTGKLADGHGLQARFEAR